MPNFKVGDEVICIDATPITAAGKHVRLLKVGREYRVIAVDHCCTTALQLAGVDTGRGTHCINCDITYDGSFFKSWRFIKLDGLQQETEIGTEKTLAENE